MSLFEKMKSRSDKQHVSPGDERAKSQFRRGDQSRASTAYSYGPRKVSMASSRKPR
jgi:hypothetical protein